MSNKQLSPNCWCVCLCVFGAQVQSDQYIPVEDIHDEMSQLERQLDQLEQRGVELERKLRDSPSGTSTRWNSY